MVTNIEIGIIIAVCAAIAAFWQGLSASGQCKAAVRQLELAQEQIKASLAQADIARQQVAVARESNMLEEIQTLYAAKYQALQSRCETIENDNRVYKEHARRCEEELRKLQHILAQIQGQGVIS